MTRKNQRYLRNQLKKSLSKLSGRKCWSMIGGGCSGRTISIQFEDKIKSYHNFINNKLTYEENVYKGEYRFLIYCYWQVEQKGETVCAWYDLRDGDKWVEVLKSLIVGKTVQSAEFFDKRTLKIHFEADLTFYIDCDCKYKASKDRNYVFFTPTGSFSLEGGLQITLNE